MPITALQDYGADRWQRADLSPASAVSSQTHELLAIHSLRLGLEYCPGPQATQQPTLGTAELCSLFSKNGGLEEPNLPQNSIA